MNLPNFAYEAQIWNQGYGVIGIDEVGRGACAGPVYVAAIYLPPLDNKQIRKLLSLKINDSKKLSAKQRQDVYKKFIKTPINYTIQFTPIEVINSQGIVPALQTAMKNALKDLCIKIDHNNIKILIDGLKSNCIKDCKFEQIPIIKGDSISLSIAASSVLAKVERDNYMTELNQTFPNYNWHMNKGYGTRSHFEAIKTHGVSPQHRHLYLRKLLGTI